MCVDYSIVLADMLNKDIPSEVLARLKLVIFDSDGVSIPRGTQISEHETSENGTRMEEIDMKTFIITDEFADMLIRLRQKLIVGVSSGRALLYLQTMFGPIIGDNTVLQAENGNVSLVGGEIVQHFEYDEEYFATLAKIRQDVEKLAIKGIEPKQFILSIHTDVELSEVYEIVRHHDKRSQLRVMYNGEAFDIQRDNVSKAAGLAKLMDKLGVKREEMIAIGDRINDREMVELAGIGVSADHDRLESEYWTTGEGLPGEQLAHYLLAHL